RGRGAVGLASENRTHLLGLLVVRARRVQAFPAAWPHDPEGGAAADGPARPGRPAQVDEPQASVELDSEHQALQAQLAEAYQSALEEKDRELAEMRARLAEARASRLWHRWAWRRRRSCC